MDDLRQRPELLLELKDGLGTRLEQGLESHEGLAFPVIRLVDHTHATGTETTQDSETLRALELHVVLEAHGALSVRDALAKAGPILESPARGTRRS